MQLFARASNYATYLTSALLRGLGGRRPDVVLCMTDPPIVADVALVIDDASTWPNKELMVRGRAELQPWEGLVPEYVLAAKRYLGEEQAEPMLAGIAGLQSVRIAVTPSWAGIIDFESRWPSALL